MVSFLSILKISYILFVTPEKLRFRFILLQIPMLMERIPHKQQYGIRDGSERPRCLVLWGVLPGRFAPHGKTRYYSVCISLISCYVTAAHPVVPGSGSGILYPSLHGDTSDTSDTQHVDFAALLLPLVPSGSRSSSTCTCGRCSSCSCSAPWPSSTGCVWGRAAWPWLCSSRMSCALVSPEPCCLATAFY